MRLGFALAFAVAFTPLLFQESAAATACPNRSDVVLIDVQVGPGDALRWNSIPIDQAAFSRNLQQVSRSPAIWFAVKHNAASEAAAAQIEHAISAEGFPLLPAACDWRQR